MYCTVLYCTAYIRTYALYKQQVRTRLPELAEYCTQMHILPKLARSAHTMAMATALRPTWRCPQKKVARFRFNFGAASSL